MFSAEWKPLRLRYNEGINRGREENAKKVLDFIAKGYTLENIQRELTSMVRATRAAGLRKDKSSKSHRFCPIVVPYILPSRNLPVSLWLNSGIIKLNRSINSERTHSPFFRSA